MLVNSSEFEEFEGKLCEHQVCSQHLLRLETQERGRKGGWIPKPSRAEVNWLPFQSLRGFCPNLGQPLKTGILWRRNEPLCISMKTMDNPPPQAP